MKALAALLLSLTTLPAMAEVRAVLVGVGDYQYLDADLKGPGPDVALMAEVLVARGTPPGNIAALSTDPALLPGGIATALPTRAAILDAMAQAASASNPGDTLLFYFSGHGSQAPDQSGDEPGGYDEILLPMDASGWKGAIAAVENAVVDDELQDWARRLLGRGVQVVGIIDACHSGTGFRAAPGAGVARVIDPALLDIPDDHAPVAPADAPPLTGDFVFLYSSQADQRSFEYPLDATDPQGRWQGSFTLALTQALRAESGASWAQVLAAARATMQRGEVRQDPDGEGPLLQAPVFGTGSATLRFPVAGGMLQAGLLAGLAEGTEVSLHSGAAEAEVLSQARLADVKATTARLDPPPPEGALWAEVTMPASQPPLRLARPVRADGGDRIDYAPWTAALDAAVAEGLAVWAGGEADLVPVLTEGTVALAAGDGILDAGGPGSTPRIAPRPDEDATAATLRMIERAAYALRFRATMAGLAGARARPSVIAMEIEHRPASPTSGGCGPAGTGAAFDPDSTLSPCDQLWLTLTNRSAKDQDVTLFYLAQDFTLTPLWPTDDLSNRLLPGESARTGLQIDAGTLPNAVEDILVVAVEATDTGARAELGRLATPDRLRGTSAGLHYATDAIERLLDPDRAFRGFTTQRPPLSFLRQTVRIRAQGQLPD
jgi:uncharacterized caspase-like protein